MEVKLLTEDASDERDMSGSLSSPSSSVPTCRCGLTRSGGDSMGLLSTSGISSSLNEGKGSNPRQCVHRKSFEIRPSKTSRLKDEVDCKKASGRDLIAKTSFSSAIAPPQAPGEKKHEEQKNKHINTEQNENKK